MASEKTKVARRVQSTEERKQKKSIFASGKYDSSQWKTRKEQIAARVKRQQDAAHARAEKRKEEAKKAKQKNNE